MELVLNNSPEPLISNSYIETHITDHYHLPCVDTYSAFMLLSHPCLALRGLFFFGLLDLQNFLNNLLLFN